MKQNRIRVKDMKNVAFVMATCSFCGKSIKSAPEIKDCSPHVCQSCFKKIREGKIHANSRTIYAHAPIEDIEYELIWNLVDELFPLTWKEAREETKRLSKKELSENMFASGAKAMLYKMLDDAEEQEKRSKQKV
ncbi:MAG: hypothetical protein ABIA93_01605 [Candidatus Woesearchaeota archaeon]